MKMLRAAAPVGLAVLAGTLVGPLDGAAAAGKPRAKLSTFSSCTDFLGYARSNAVDKVLPTMPLYRPAPDADGPVTASGGGAGGSERVTPAASEDQAAAPATGGPSEGPEFSTTNNQEAGVDEPDIVKTDGRWIYATAKGKLYALSVLGTAEPRRVDSIDLGTDEGSDQEMLLAGNRLLVLSGSYDGTGQKALLTEVDVSDPHALRVVRQLAVDGAYVSGRLVGTTARIVLRSTPEIIEELPYFLEDGQTMAQGRTARRKKVRLASSKQWLPKATIRRGLTGPRLPRRLVSCGDVRHPHTFGGLTMVTVLTLDLAKGIEAIDTDSVMTDAETVYASATSLYVASERWADLAPDRPGASSRPYTSLHKFDISDPASTTYKGSGSVPGYLLNQFSLSEKDGLLRAATTSARPWWDGTEGEESESEVRVLEDTGAGLQTIGRVGGMGKGERIYSVRFVGDMGYVVTFRETDPLYTVDLSDPRAPRVRGELKILGFSAYLHPIGEHLLLGVGQDATDRGETLGTQLSVFDVSNPDNPVRTAQMTMSKYSSSEAEYDHKAFLFWPKTGMTVIPVDDWDRYVGTRWVPFAGAFGFAVGRDGIRKVGQVSHVQSREEYEEWTYEASIRRSVVVGDTLYTVSEAGIAASSLDTMADKGWSPFS